MAGEVSEQELHPMTQNSVDEVVVHARGEVGDADRVYAEDKIARLLDSAPKPVLFARVDLTAHADPARDRPAFAKASLDLNGRRVGAHVAAETMREAIDLLQDRLADRLGRLAGQVETTHRRPRSTDEHEWRHGDPVAVRPGYYPRPVGEREVVRRKSFAIGEMTPDEAVFDLELLDHDFYLFENLETGEDNVVARAADATYELYEPSATCSVVETAADICHSPVRPSTLGPDQAIELLDAGDLPFVFFVDVDTGRGCVAYRRYDGHYGILTPADA
jgi:ribosome-associated translation inhibitor RaiA